MNYSLLLAELHTQRNSNKLPNSARELDNSLLLAVSYTPRETSNKLPNSAREMNYSLLLAELAKHPEKQQQTAELNERDELLAATGRVTHPEKQQQTAELSERARQLAATGS